MMHNARITSLLANTDRPTSTTEKWERLSHVMQEAQSVLPDAKPIKCRRWETSVNTLALVEERSNK